MHRECVPTLLLVCTTVLVHTSVLEEYDLWPLVTPLLGDISPECRNASERYVSLLTDVLFHPAVEMTEDHLHAVKRFDSNGPIPFLQEGVLQDIKTYDICSLPVPDLNKLSCEDLPDGIRYISVPYGNAAGPGMEAGCRSLPDSKYCHNLITSHKRTTAKQVADIMSQIGRDAHSALNQKIPGTFKMQSESLTDKSISDYPFQSSHSIEKLEDNLPKLSEILIQRNSYIQKIQPSLTEALQKWDILKSKDPVDARVKGIAILIFIWWISNITNGPYIGLPAPYQGVCYPDACTKDDIYINNILFADAIFNQTNLPTIVAAPQNARWFGQDVPTINQVGCSDDDRYRGEWKVENGAVVTLFAFIGLFILIGTAVDIHQRNCNSADEKEEKDGFGFLILTSFSLVSNLEFIFKTSSHKGSNRLDCFEGMRAISMTWVVLGHNFLFGGYFLHGRNTEYVRSLTSEKHAGGFAFEAIMQGEYSVDSFLFIGATLLSYLLLKDLDKSKGWFHSKGPLRIVFYYLNRYLRITIPLALVIAAVVGVIPLMLTEFMGAQSQATVDAEDCKTNWYRHLLYYNIWGKRDLSQDGCIGQTWYLAFDMEWFLVSPLVVYPLWMSLSGSCKKVFGIVWWSLIFVGFFTANVFYVYNKPEFDKYHNEHFLPPWNFAPWGHRSFCYLLGLMMGYILHATRDMKISIHWILNIAMWILTFVVAFALVYGPIWNHIPVNPDYTPAFNVMYKACWGLCLCWVTFACVKGYGGPVNDFLSWGLWSPISKISFMTYLFHMSPNFQYFAMQDYNVDFSMWLLTEIFVAQLAFDLLLGLIGCLTLELPFGKIQKLILQKLLGGRQ